MPGRDTSFDNITYTLLTAFVNVLSPLSGWGQLGDGSYAVYPHLGLPMPQEPFPALYMDCEARPDYTSGSSIRNDNYLVFLRMIGGPATPGYQFNPEDKVNQMLTAIINELDYRPFLQDPSNNDTPFRYLAPGATAHVVDSGRTRAFNYSDQGNFIGRELVVQIGLRFNVGRIG